MLPLLYTELVAWYDLVDPAADHADEAASYQAAISRARPTAETLLDLGSGAGNNAFFLKSSFACTLVDLSEPMLELSRARNPECEHLQGDLRTLRLGRTFDAVLVHDAIMYMCSEAELAAAIATAYAHTRPNGGVAVFTPDCVRDDFADHTATLFCDAGTRSVRGLEWKWDPDPSDETCVVEYAFLLRDGTSLRAVHDRHVHGLFTRATWRRLFEQAGYRVDVFARPLDDGSFDECFLCTRP